MDKGTAANLAAAGLLGIAAVLPAGAVREALLATGLFALSGGLTNALAVKMLFDRIPGLVGSGVIPARFEEIRREIRRLILENFFDEAFLKAHVAEAARETRWMRYVKSSRGDGDPVTRLIEENWTALTSRETLRPILRRQAESIVESGVGRLLVLVGTEAVEEALGTLVERFLASARPEILAAARARIEEASRKAVTVDVERLVPDLRAEVEKLLDRKLEELDARKVRDLLHQVMRRHLGWLVVWGAVFGGLLGLAGWAAARFLPG